MESRFQRPSIMGVKQLRHDPSVRVKESEPKVMPLKVEIGRSRLQGRK